MRGASRSHGLFPAHGRLLREYDGGSQRSLADESRQLMAATQ